MQTAAEIIASAEEFFDRDALELQIDYCKTILAAAIREYGRPESSAALSDVALAKSDAKAESPKPQPPSPKPQRRARISLAQSNLCNQNLSLLTEALRLQKLLVRTAVNRALGAESPFADSPLPEHTGDLYAEYCDRRLLLKPARARSGNGSRGPGAPGPFPPAPPRPRAQVDNYFHSLGGPARSPSNGNGSSRNAKQSRNSEPDGGTTARQEAAPALSLLKGNAWPEPAVSPSNTHAQAVEQWGEQANHWLREADIRKPMPTLTPQAEEWLEQQAQQDPQAARWLQILNEMKKIDHLMQFKAGVPADLSDGASAKSEALAKAGAGGPRQTVQN
jgi:hypothetical protein